MVDQNAVKYMDEFVELWRSLGYHYAAELPLLTLAGSYQGVERFGSEANAFKKLVELTSECKDEQAVIDEFYALVIGE